jgi:taurine dioxygenase
MQNYDMKRVNTQTAIPLTITPSGQACGATVTGLDLRAPLSTQTIADIRAAWLSYHVLVFPDQALTPQDLERFTQSFGVLGQDPFITPLPGHQHIIPVQRHASETGPIFADTWHSDWSFLEHPPIGTCLYSLTIPPIGGDTLFANQQTALNAMPDELRVRVTGLHAIHSGVHAYAPGGTYSKMDAANRGMVIAPSKTAYASVIHPLVKPHSETGRKAVFGAPGHIIGIEGLDDTASKTLLGALYRWQTRSEFQYRHKWASNMLVMWDNRSVIHMATGGYAGYERLLHRTMIWPPEARTLP